MNIPIPFTDPLRVCPITALNDTEARAVAEHARIFAEKHAPMFQPGPEDKRRATSDAAAFFCGMIATQLPQPAEKIYCYSIFLGEVQDVVMDMKF